MGLTGTCISVITSALSLLSTACAAASFLTIELEAFMNPETHCLQRLPSRPNGSSPILQW
jgi:hypothetical protein